MDLMGYGEVFVALIYRSDGSKLKDLWIVVVLWERKGRKMCWERCGVMVWDRPRSPLSGRRPFKCIKAQNDNCG